MIRVDLKIKELEASTLFQMIDVKTSYNLLLGHPWVHENDVVPSTLYQCFKFPRGENVVKVTADIKPDRKSVV